MNDRSKRIALKAPVSYTLGAFPASTKKVRRARNKKGSVTYGSRFFKPRIELVTSSGVCTNPQKHFQQFPDLTEEEEEEEEVMEGEKENLSPNLANNESQSPDLDIALDAELETDEDVDAVLLRLERSLEKLDEKCHKYNRSHTPEI